MSNYDHVIYKNDPVLFKSYVNKRCAVTATDKSVHTGIVYTVDPVTESIVLIEEAHSEEQRLKFIMGHSVQEVEVLGDVVKDSPQLFQRSSLEASHDFVGERKKAVISLLVKNRFAVTENNDIVQIENIVSIKPPYSLEDCVSTNSIVLTRIHNILSQLDQN